MRSATTPPGSRPVRWPPENVRSPEPEIGARAERPAGPGHDNRARLGVGVDRVERGAELALHRVGERVEPFRAVQRDAHDPVGVGAVVEDRLVRCRHVDAERARSSSFTTLPVAFTGNSSRNSTKRGTLKFAISPRAHSMISRRLDRRTGLEHDERLRDFAEAFVGNADHGDLRDARMAQHQVLDLGGIRVEPADDEHVLDAPDDAQVAVGVDRAEVAGVQPTVGVDRGRGRFRVVEISARHRLAAHDDLAGLARRGVGARFRDGPNFEAGPRRLRRWSR